jgi:hypothetical protein
MKVGDHSPHVSADTSIHHDEPAGAGEAKSAEKEESLQHIVQDSERQAGYEKRSEMQITGKLVATQLLATTEPKTPAAQKVESAIEKSRANGGDQRDAVIAGAKADEGDVDANSAAMQGKDRMREIYKSSGIDIGNPKYNDKAQPLLKTKEGVKPNHWCGVWATDIWKRSGVEARWVTGQGISTADGKKLLPHTNISGRNDKNLEKVKPGDVVVTDSFEIDDPKKQKSGSPHHHAIVTDVVYEVAGNPPIRATHPPDAVPEGGKVVGFHTMNGNSAGVPKPDGSNPAIRPGYIDLTQPNYYEANGKTYETRISTHYPMPEKKTPETG